MKPLIAAAIALCVLTNANGASAHHSGAMFEPAKTVTLTGTIKEFKWINPHAWVHIMAPDAKGEMQEWQVECSTINIISRKGWTAKSLKPGDKVALVVRPAKDGRAEGLMMNATLPGGKVLYDHNY